MASNLIPCPAPDCTDGVVLVYNAYSADPLKPEEQRCEFCGGAGSILSGDELATAN